MPNAFTITSIPGRSGSLYYMRGDKKIAVARNLDLSDAGAVQVVIDNARRDFPTQALKLAVYRKSGTANVTEKIIEVSQPALAGPNPDEMTHVATRPAPFTPGVPPGLDAMTTFVLATTHQQLAEKESLVIDLRDDKKRLEEQNRALEKKISELDFELKGKDRDHEYALRDAVSSQPKGLAGIGEVVSQLPPDLLTMLATRFLGPAPGAAPVAQLGSHLSEAHRQVVQYLNERATESEEVASKMYFIISQAVSSPSGFDQLIAFCQTTFPQLRAA